jgi:glutathione S-transferase
MTMTSDIVLYHHPYSRAAGTVWALEEVGVPYRLKFVDLMKGEQKGPEVLALNPMGKLPVLTDGDLVITESAAIALYLADRYAIGRLAPPLDDPRRGTYLRWSLFSPSVIEPGASAKAGKWETKEGAVGWGNFDAMMTTIHSALEGKQFLLGDTFSMADVVFGGTLRYLTRFKMIEATPQLSAYIERLDARPAYQRAEERNAAVRDEHGLK